VPVSQVQDVELDTTPGAQVVGTVPADSLPR
jgi:hypothetical protein